MKFSVIMHTCRKDNKDLPSPVLQMMMDSMLSQDFRGEIELIIVDLLWERRREQFTQLLQRVGEKFRVLHVPDRPSPFKDKRLTRIAGPKNTGAILASGTHLVFTDDCQVIPSNSLSLLAEAASMGIGATMCYEKRHWCGPSEQDASCGSDQRGKNYGIHGIGNRVVPVNMIGYLGGTMSMLPIDTFETLNGFDEMFDGARQLEDSDMIIRLSALGQNMMYEGRSRIIEYECGAYGDVIDGGSVKCNAAYGYHMWRQKRVRANDLVGDRLMEAIREMPWKNCIRLKGESTCINYGHPCIKVGDNPDLIREIYTDPRLVFDIKQIRESIRTGRVAISDVLGVQL
jgi:hypothetical protein